MNHHLYEKLLENASNMLLACEGKNWPLVVQQQEDYLDLIEKIKQENNQEGLQDVQMIQRILKTTREIIHEVELQQEQLSQDLLHLRRQKKHSDHYKQQ